jgi:hypothetical protein
MYDGGPKESRHRLDDSQTSDWSIVVAVALAAALAIAALLV